MTDETSVLKNQLLILQVIIISVRSITITKINVILLRYTSDILGLFFVYDLARQFLLRVFLLRNTDNVIKLRISHISLTSKLRYLSMWRPFVISISILILWWSSTKDILNTTWSLFKQRLLTFTFSLKLFIKIYKLFVLKIVQPFLHIIIIF